MKHNVEHVFFDLDRTLWDFETNSKEALRELFHQFGLADRVNVGEAEFLPIYEAINEKYWESYRTNTITQQELRTGRFADALAHFGHHDTQLAQAMGEAYVHLSPRKTTLVDGTLELLDHLSGRYALHIITNGFEEVQHIKLSASGIDGYFGEIITSERAGVKKPDAAIFRFAEQLTNAVPQRSVMIGDHFDADVQGAKAVGWHAIYFEPAGNRHGDHHHVSSLRDVMQLL